MRGYARMLLEERAGGINPTQRSYLEVILENANRLMGLAKDLTRIAAGPPLSLRAIDLKELCEDSLALLEAQLQKKRIVVCREGAPGPMVVLADRERLFLIVYKLLSTAIDIARQGADLHLEFMRSDDQSGLRWSDGSAVGVCGLIQQVLEHGAGLTTNATEDNGFSQLHDIILQHGGRISACNSQEKGYTCTLMFPSFQPDNREMI